MLDFINTYVIGAALPLVLSALKGQGFEFVTLSQLVHTEGYTIDSNGIQHKNA